MSLVLDASAFLVLMLGEGEPAFREVLHGQLRRIGAYIPALWWYEISNALMVGVRRGRYSPAFARVVLEKADNYMIFQDRRDLSYISAKLFDLAEKHKLTVYDASYLELAIEKGASIATLDRALARAAIEAGAALLRV